MAAGSSTSPSAISGKSAHFKVLIFCLLCTAIYIYLYSEVSMQTIKIQELMQGTLKDFKMWKNSIEKWVDHLSKGTAVLMDEEKNDEIHPLQNNSSEIDKKQDGKTPMTEKDMWAQNIKDGKEKALLTLFTTWPSKAEKYLCHNNTVLNWNSLKPFVIPLLFSNESILGNEVSQKGWKLLPVSRTGNGIPILKYMFLDAVKQFDSHFYAYSNGDILFTDQLIESLKEILASKSINKSIPMLIVGQRTNVQDVTKEEASSWTNILKIAKSRGKLFTSYAEDFFITMRNYPWKAIPDLVIGRRAYDNWVVLNARKQKFSTIDITATSFAVHQTTKAGNFEGHHHKDGNYNHNLLSKLYKTLRYQAGLTSCTEKRTLPTATGQTKVQNRNVPKSCFPI